MYKIKLKRLALNILWVVVFVVSFIVAFIACFVHTIISNFIAMCGILFFEKVVYCKAKRKFHRMAIASVILWFSDYLSEKLDKVKKMDV